MVSHKLRAILRIIRSKQFVLVSEKNGHTDGMSGGEAKDLAGIMAMAVETKQLYNMMTEMINNVAIETGELHTVQAMRDALDKLEKN